MNNENNALKMRFRLANGEEFEAQGTREFIETQRNQFLALIGQRGGTQQSAICPQANCNTPPAKTWPQAKASGLNGLAHTELYLWEKALKEDGQTLFLRKKTKLNAPEIALLLIAGAKKLLNKNEYPALELAKSLKACGIEGGRLDRMLAGELASGRILAQGNKRARAYKLSSSGEARAFVLVEKIFQETRK